MVTDQLGSTSLLVNTSSPPSVVFRQYYKPYGEVAFQNGSSLTSVGYTGQRLDGDSGLMYYGARYYDPVLSYFVSADPTTPDAANAVDYEKYLYVRGNPLRFLDSLGYAPEDNYIFVEGCVPGSSGSGDCGHPDWGEYTSLLMAEFSAWQWDYAQQGKEWTYGTYATWASTHVHNVFATSAGAGAEQIEGVVSGLPSGAGVHLFGHSMGGAAVIEYLNRMRKLEGSIANGDIHNAYVKSYLMRAYGASVKSAIFVDAADPPALDNPAPGFGNWLASKGIQVLDVDTQNDWVQHSELSGIPHITDPHYGCSQEGCPPPVPGGPPYHMRSLNTLLDPNRGAWHEWTGKHMAEESLHFLAEAWR